MANNTPNYNLYKKDAVTDKNDTFNITTMLNENWDKIDTELKNIEDNKANTNLSNVSNADLLAKGTEAGLETPTGAQEKADTAETNAINTAKTLFSNPNLLINSWLGSGVINQREQTIYNATGYTVSHWMLVNGADKITVQSDGLLYETSANAFGFRQYVEDYAKYAGKTVTLSFYVSELNSTNAQLNIRSGASQNKAITLQNGLNVLTYDIPSNPEFLYVQIYMASGSSVKLHWAKLEEGSVATPFVPRPYGEELALCQRHYERITGFRVYNSKAGLTSMAAENLYIFFATKRTVPTVSFEYELSSNPNNWIKSSPTHIDVNKFTDFNNIVFDCEFVSVRNVVIDAEIY